MPIDASIYRNAAPVQAPDTGDITTSMENGMRLGQLGMQQSQMRMQMQQQMAMRKAMAANTDPNTGQIDQAGYLSSLGKMSPMAAMDEQGRLAGLNKAQAEAQQAQLAASEKTLNTTQPMLSYMMNKVPPDQRSKVWPEMRAQMAATGVPMNGAPPSDQWDDNWGNTALTRANQTKEYIDKQKMLADIGKAPEELKNLKYGARSASSEIASQYNNMVKPIQSSQMAMNQMIDNYKNPSPQGDASLVLNAFKIKFPTAPDVNSLKELSESQSAPDAFKLAANKVLKGGLDQGTRENIMRDGISTYRGNVDSLRGIQDKYNTMAKTYGVNSKPITNEPAIEKTYAEAMDLQKQVGPYVPPTERPGIMGSLYGFASKKLGLDSAGAQNAATAVAQKAANIGQPTANAAPPSEAQANMRKAGSQVSGDELAQYAMKHNMKLEDAKTYLKGQGYAIGK